MQDGAARLLLLGVYGMEVVECGGVLCKNALLGGKSFASIMLSREETRFQVKRAAQVLGVEIGFTDFKYGEVDVTLEGKKKLVRVIRETKPDIIITQDPEHSLHDLDPDRRLAMLLILESIALAARDFACEEMPDLSIHPVPTIYYMNSERPNCVVNVADVWVKKEAAMDELKSQMEFSGKYFETYYSINQLKAVLPNWEEITDDYTKGREMHKVLDKTLSLYHGVLSHQSRYTLVEAYRREGKFQLNNLIK